MGPVKPQNTQCTPHFLESSVQPARGPVGFAFSKFLAAPTCGRCSFATGSHKDCILDVRVPLEETQKIQKHEMAFEWNPGTSRI